MYTISWGPIVYGVNKLFLKNIIRDPNTLHNLPRETLIKLINLIPAYLEANLVDLVDERIKKIEDELHITVSNIRIEDIKSSLKTHKWEHIIEIEGSRIYKYPQFVKIFFSGKETNTEVIVAKLTELIKIKDYEEVHLNSKNTTKRPHIFETSKIAEEGKVWELIEQHIKKFELISTLTLTLYIKAQNTPLKVEKRPKKKR